MSLTKQEIKELEKEFNLTPIDVLEAKLDKHIENIKRLNTQINPSNKLYNLSEASKILGFSRQALRSIIDNGELRIKTLNNRPYVPHSEIERLNKF